MTLRALRVLTIPGQPLGLTRPCPWSRTPCQVPGAINLCPSDTAAGPSLPLPIVLPCPPMDPAKPGQPTSSLPAQPQSIPISRQLTDGWGCPSVPWLPCSWLGRWDRPWLPGPAMTVPGSPGGALTEASPGLPRTPSTDHKSAMGRGMVANASLPQVGRGWLDQLQALIQMHPCKNRSWIYAGHCFIICYDPYHLQEFSSTTACLLLGRLTQKEFSWEMSMTLCVQPDHLKCCGPSKISPLVGPGNASPAQTR